MAWGRRGFTLFEMSVALLILAAIGLLAVGSLRSAEPERLSMAAGEVANALRYARSDALRHGALRAVFVDPSSDSVTVLQVHMLGGTPVAGPPLPHPLEPGPYQFALGELRGAGPVEIRNSEPPFEFEDVGARLTTVVFGPEGNPMWWDGGRFKPLKAGAIELGLGDHELSVGLLPSGRVVVP